MSLLPQDLIDAASAVIEASRQAGLAVATAESCTGGLVAAALTSVPGSSEALDRGFVTYSNAAKGTLLGVPLAQIEAHGAVSEPVSRAMAEGALSHSLAGAAIAITGIAGPGGGSPSKPVGLVHFAAAHLTRPTIHHAEIFQGDRDAVRLQATRKALEMLRDILA